MYNQEFLQFRRQKKIRILDLEICLDDLKGEGLGCLQQTCFERLDSHQNFCPQVGQAKCRVRVCIPCAHLNLFSEHFLPQVAHVYSCIQFCVIYNVSYTCSHFCRPSHTWGICILSKNLYGYLSDC